MKKILYYVTLFMLIITLGVAEEMNQKEKNSMAVAAELFEQINFFGEDVDFDQIIAYLQKAKKGEQKFDSDEISAILNSLQQAAQQRIAGANKKRGIEFLEKNKKEKDVKVTESGLQYKVITLGTGAKPEAENTVKVHYKGSLLDGSVFDSSYERGPASFGLKQVIPAWTEGLQLMPTGSKFIFYIPSELAYGEKGARGAIGPNETLVFEVELLEIVK